MGDPQQLLQNYINLPPGQCEAYIEPLAEEVRRLVRKSLIKKETGDLEDFEQDCLLGIWTRIDAIKRGAVEGTIENLEAFVRRAVHNRYCDAIRRKRPAWYNLKLELLDVGIHQYTLQARQKHPIPVHLGSSRMAVHD